MLSATRNGHAEIVEALIKAGADVAVGDMVCMLLCILLTTKDIMLVYDDHVE